ncbi:hypothetical protein FHR83_004099 [Actinoplanes campanulatus]|uniref:Uncharacterized protein n=1 Tax=Actinoplanes campanulatus TaxID=113559 RepID=A0A7W5FFE8_9ACTN|nr:hypothetical protein [Actinoplanes campanulatus]MBB3096429.1 hypothetical protein [Actinoplanes campanulatus]GGN18376.1 hypothetical protein GCM10010109_31410 [Actinoplanes campanulatus]GID38495.1 hypothetical protein Aca09nite_50010 [Actinoplanes campanulatus]
MDVSAATTALATALRYDPSLAGEPDRLARALEDLLPGDERTVALLVAAARAGVPELLAGGHAEQARDRLTGYAGFRPEIAAQLLAAWSGDDTGTPAESPGPPAAVALGDGPVLALVTGSGVFTGSAGAWRRVASPPGATSRDVALAGGHVLWTAPGGVFARRLTADDPRPHHHTADEPRPNGHIDDEPRIVATADQVRYPLAAVCPDGSTVDVFWTPDRVRIEHAALRDWGGTSSLTVPPAPSGERLTALAAATGSARTVWLAALTEAGTTACARWDLTAGIGDWTPVDPPARLATLTLAGRWLLAYTVTGHLLAYDLDGARQWRSVDHPAGVARFARAPHAIAATRDLLLVAGPSGTWTAPLDSLTEVPRLGPATLLNL